MTSRDAVNILSSMDITRFDDKEQEALTIAISALWRQVPMEAKEVTPFRQDPDLVTAYCPRCHEIVGNENIHCTRCGQRLDWEEWRDIE